MSLSFKNYKRVVCFQLVSYPDWWPRNAGRGFSPANHSKSWRGGRSGRGGRQHLPTPRPRATDGGRPSKAWAYSASVRQARTAAENFSLNRRAGKEEGRGPGGPIYSDGPGSRPRSSSNRLGSAGPGPGPFPALTVDQWSTLLTALQTSSNTQSEKLFDQINPTHSPPANPNPPTPSHGPLTHGPAPLFPPHSPPPLSHTGSHLSSSPPPTSPALAKASGSLFDNPDRYRRLIGKLIYLTLTRPELAYAVHTLAQFMHAPRHAHWDAAIRVVRYLKGSPGRGIFLSSNSPLSLTSYCDSDWATCPITRRSLTGYFISLGGSPISWKTKKQHTISRSSAEAEYRSMAMTLCELKWLSILLRDLHVPITRPIPLHCDNQAALHIAENPIVILFVMLSKTVLSFLYIFTNRSYNQVTNFILHLVGEKIYPGSKF
ncbi:hypothetical protein M9H77_09265 [Catharanthus roseus]|uniref:Uncharacterized protein n=1 Tax=Catharanthus roseus TaxID=4058 RepID=A0ACC0C0A0_CATRO|nr:hypothetical protein M9H77_09265 [Catharanthus roseus]